MAEGWHVYNLGDFGGSLELNLDSTKIKGYWESSVSNDTIDIWDIAASSDDRNLTMEVMDWEVHTLGTQYCMF